MEWCELTILVGASSLSDVSNVISSNNYNYAIQTVHGGWVPESRCRLPMSLSPSTRYQSPVWSQNKTSQLTDSSSSQQDVGDLHVFAPPAARDNWPVLPPPGWCWGWGWDFLARTFHPLHHLMGPSVYYLSGYYLHYYLYCYNTGQLRGW